MQADHDLCCVIVMVGPRLKLVGPTPRLCGGERIVGGLYYNSLIRIAVDIDPHPGDTPAMNDLHAYCLEIATRAKTASADLAVVTGAQKQAWLRASSKRLVELYARAARSQPA